MRSPNGHRCPDCPGSQRARIMLSRSAFRAEEQRTRKGVAVLVGCTAEECSVSEQEKIAGSESEVQFHCFLQFSQVNFNVSEKEGSKSITSKKCQVRTYLCMIQAEKEQGLKSTGVLNPGLERLSLSGAEAH